MKKREKKPGKIQGQVIGPTKKNQAKVGPDSFALKETKRHIKAVHALLMAKEELPLIEIAKIRDFFLYILERCEMVLKSQGAIDKRMEVVDMRVIERRRKIFERAKWWQWRKRKGQRMQGDPTVCIYCEQPTTAGDEQCDGCWEVTHRLEAFIAMGHTSREYVVNMLKNVMRIQA